MGLNHVHIDNDNYKKFLWWSISSTSIDSLPRLLDLHQLGLRLESLLGDGDLVLSGGQQAPVVAVVDWKKEHWTLWQCTRELMRQQIFLAYIFSAVQSPLVSPKAALTFTVLYTLSHFLKQSKHCRIYYLRWCHGQCWRSSSRPCRSCEKEENVSSIQII